MPPRDRSLDSFMASLAEDEPEGSAIRRFAEERRLVPSRNTTIPSWCAVNAWIQERSFGSPKRIVHLGPSVAHLQSPDEPGTSYVRYEHLPLWEPTSPPPQRGRVRGRRANAVIIDDAWAVDLETAIPNRYTTADIGESARETAFYAQYQAVFAEGLDNEQAFYSNRTASPRNDPPSYDQLEGRTEGRRVSPAPRPKPAPSRYDRDDVV